MERTEPGIWDYSRALALEGLRGMVGINDHLMAGITIGLVTFAAGSGYWIHTNLAPVGRIWVPIALGIAFLVAVSRVNWEHILRITETEKVVIQILEDKQVVDDGKRKAIEVARGQLTDIKLWATSRSGVPAPAVRHFTARLRGAVNQAAVGLNQIGESAAVDRLYGDPLWAEGDVETRDDLLASVDRVEAILAAVLGVPVA